MDLNKRIEEAFNKVMEEGTQEALEAYKTLLDLKKVQEGQDSIKVEENKKEELSETQKFIRALRDTLGAMPTGSTIAVPTEVAAQIEKKRYEYSNLRRLCTVHRASGNYAIQVEGTGVTVGYVAEGGAIGDGTPTIDCVTLGAYKLGALVKMSNEMLQDAEADLEAYITDLFAKGFGLMEDAEILNGTGTNHMTGIVTAAGADRKVTAAAAGTVTWAEVKAAVQKLNGGYRARATAVMSQALADAIHEMKDGGKYIFDQNQPLSNIMGIKVVISPDLTGPATASKPMMVVGDFSYYHIADRKELSVKRLDEAFAANDQTGFIAVERIDGKPTQTEAFAVLVSHA